MARGRRRTQYVRDNSGRFASTPGGGPSKATPASVRKAAKAAVVKGGTLQSRTSLKRSRAKLAAIDKADETLKTALSRRAQKGAVTRGQKAARAAIKSSQSKLSVAPKMSVIKKKRKAAQPVLQSMKNETTKATGQRIRPGEFVRANLRPRNVMAKPVKGEDPFGMKNQTKSRNIEIARIRLAKEGYVSGVYSEGDRKRRKGGQSLAKTLSSAPLYNSEGRVSFNEPEVRSIHLNKAANYWRNPTMEQRRLRSSGWTSSSSPVHVLLHEVGHMRDLKMGKRGGGVDPWFNQYGTNKNTKKGLAKRVSGYAAQSPDEFVAETYAGRRTGRKYDYQVMSAYRETKGLNPNPIVRKLKKKGKTKPNP